MFCFNNNVACRCIDGFTPKRAAKVQNKPDIF
jgi:hypothetical protein